MALSALLSTEAAAEYLDMHPKSLYRIKERGDITCKSKGGRNFYTKASLQRFLKSRQKARS